MNYYTKTHRMFRQAKRTVRLVFRTLKRQFRRNPRVSVMGLLFLIALGGAFMQQFFDEKQINNSAYHPLLQTIAKGESRGNYNAHFGNAANTKLRFTEMTLAEVLQWQEDYVRQGQPSNAVGKYQIIHPTLKGLIRQLRLSLDELYDEPMQDRLAIALLERRGAKEFAAKRLSRQQFAANLAQEWAALPKATGDDPQKSHYAGDGLNQALVSLDEVYSALAFLEQRAYD